MIQKLSNRLNDRKKDTKGFTLVELIVVIVILAILAAILIPGLLKWIDEAKEKQYQLEARSIMMATQAVIAEEYNGTIETFITMHSYLGDKQEEVARISELSGLNVILVQGTMNEKGVFTSFKTTFDSSDGTEFITREWTAGGQWEVGEY